jgi:hypothetical protein
MTELKPKDVIKLVSDKEELNGFFLIDDIDSTEIKLLQPPDKAYTLGIHDGIIEDVSEITVVYVSPVTGVAFARNFIPGKTIIVTFKDGTEEIGIIKELDEDMIEVEFETKTEYIDFGYTGFPDHIQNIILDEGFIIEDGEDYFLPEANQRFTLDRQLTDLMDTLLSLPNQTSKSIQNAKQIVQRFRELRYLFSTDTLTPLHKSHDYRPRVHPHQVKWIMPVTDTKRILYDSEEKSTAAILELEKIQTNSDHRTDGTYKWVVKAVLDEFRPFMLSTNGEPIHKTTTALIKKGRAIKVNKAKDTEFEFSEKKWIPQVFTSPHSIHYYTKQESRRKMFSTSELTTNPEVADFVSYYVLPDYAIEYTKAYCLTLPLIERIKSDRLTPYIRPLPDGKKVKTIEECAFDVTTSLSKMIPFYSIQQGIKQLSPYLIYKNDVTIDHSTYLKTKMNTHINFYTKKQTCLEYRPNPLHEYDEQSASERQVAFLHQDNGSLYAIQTSKLFEMDYKGTLDKHINKAVDTTKPVAPPVVKEYTSVNDLNNAKEPVFYDEKYDPTNYDELEVYDTAESMMRFLIENKKMTPQHAFIYAPHFLKRKRIVINGEYARLTVKNTPSYYKRVNKEWKLDETCTGPYPCVSNEPDCDDCVDISFRLKQNLLSSILHEYEIGTYASEIDRTNFIDLREHFLEQREEHLKQNRYRILTKYNDSFKSLSKSIVVIDVSPNQSLLLSILQKPYDEKYKELKHFIQTKTRVAKSSEDPAWVYCTISDIKLIPAVFSRILEGYENNTYLSTLQSLKREGLLVDDSAHIVTVTGGFIVSSISFVDTFDDAVRSSEIEDDAIFVELNRDDHPFTPAVVDILTKISELLKVDISKYFNYMIRTVVAKPPSILLSQSIALMLKIANIVKNVDINDKIKIILLNEAKFKTLLSKYTKISQEPLTVKSITDEIATVSGYYDVQVIAREKDKKRVMIRSSLSTLWETFLPPTIKGVSKHPTKSMEILQEIHYQVNGKVPLREGTYKVNTVPGSFLTERVTYILDHIHNPVLPKYTTSKLFVQEPRKSIHDGDVKIVILPSKSDHPLSLVNRVEYNQQVSDLKSQLSDLGIEIPDDFIPYQTSLTYMSTFIHNIARTFPKIIMKNPEYEYAIPVSLKKLIGGSRTHGQTLNDMMDKHYIKELCKYSPDNLNLDRFLKDQTIDDLLPYLNLPVDETRIYEYECYIYLIFLKYYEYGDRQCINLLRFYINLFKTDRSKIFLSYDEIKRLTLKDKVSESNEIRLSRHKLSADDKYMSDFRQLHNIDEAARLGRLRDYNAQNRDADADRLKRIEERHTLLDEDVREDNDRGGDGDHNDDGDDE